ncbi:Laminin-like protein epi-1 [Bienertia sinuspersici]
MQVNIIDAHDPLEKLDGIAKVCSDLQHSATSFEQEAKKSKKSAELLLAELNEVQERNDGLQEELEKAYNEISNLSKERDLANSAKVEALSHLDNLSAERENRLVELERLKSSVQGVKKVFLDLSALSDDMFVKDLEHLRNLTASMESYLEPGVDMTPAKDHVSLVSVNSRFKILLHACFSQVLGRILSRTSVWGNKIPDHLDESAGFDICEVFEQHLQKLTEMVSDFKERIQGHSMSLSSLESIKDEKVRKAKLSGESSAAEHLRNSLPALPTVDGVKFSSPEESVKDLADKLSVAQQLQEKDIQRERICMELVSQIKEAEATTSNCFQDLQSMKHYAKDLENKLEALGKDKSLLEQRVNEQQQERLSSTELREKVESLTAMVAAKEQEIEVLMQALDEEENQMEAIRMKVEEWEKAVQQKNVDLEHVEASRSKALKSSPVTVSKFDDCTTCLKKRQRWQKSEVLEKNMISDLERFNICNIGIGRLRIAAQSKEILLQAERKKGGRIVTEKNVLEALLHEKEQHLNSVQGIGVPGSGTSEIVELEPVVFEQLDITSTFSQVRSLRKVNNDQVAIAIDTDAGSSGRIEDEDDDKIHGFKSLTTSRFVPKFTRPVNDMIDGLWVSCDRALMRQPALRLGIMIYWAVLHAFLASFIV